MFSGKADNRVNPSPVEGGNTPFSTSSGGGIKGGGGDGRNAKRPTAPATVGGGKSSAKSQKISKSVKAVKNFFKHPVSERNMAVVRDIEQTTAEIWITFMLTVLVGCFFLGGGIYLIWLGRKNNGVDFMVVGGVGTVMGFCLNCVGMFLFCKPLCLAHRERKQERLQERLQAAENAEYVSRAKAKLLTLQIADRLTNRRPSQVELYGHQREGSPPNGGKPGSRIQNASSSATIYDPPPPVALPDRPKDGHWPGDRAASIILARETSADDRFAIANAAERKDLFRRAQLRRREQQSEDPPASAGADTPLPDPAVRSGSETAVLRLGSETPGSDHADHHPDESTFKFNTPPQKQGSYSDLLEELSELPESKETDNNKPVSHSPEMTRPNVTINVDHEEEEEESSSAERRRSVLSAVNDRRMSVSQESEDEDDKIEVVPH